MELFLQRLVDGLGNGIIYGIVALALVIIFRSTGMLNFAQGEMAMMSTFLTWTLTDKGLPVWLAIVVSMAISFVAGALIERIVVRPVEGKNTLAAVIVTIGMFLTINALATWQWASESKSMPTPWPRRTWEIGGVRVDSHVVFMALLLVGVVFLLSVLFNQTKLGLSLRAAASNRESAALVGISVSQTLMIGWGLAAAIGALAGAMVAPTLFVDANMMQGVIVYAFAAATLGGFDSPGGAIIAGLIVGVVESLAAGYVGWIGADLKLATAFLLILFILIFRPAGLFGRVEVSRV